MKKYQKATKEFNEKLHELKKETHPTIYGSDLTEIILYDKLLELQDSISMLKAKMSNH